MPTTSTTPRTVDSLLRVVEARDAEVALLKLMVDKLKVQLLCQMRGRFGSSSEQLNDRQIALIEGGPPYEVPPAAKPPKKEAANSDGFDRSLPVHLPRENHVYRPKASNARHDAAGQACGRSACGGRLRQIGQDVSEQLEYVPARFKVIRHVRPKLACTACESIFQAPASSRPIARGVAGPGLLAHVCWSSMPDERCRERQSRAGPLLEELFAWLGAMLGQVSAKSELARAIGYTLTRLRSLTRYRDDGSIEIDNNAAERALRGVSLGQEELPLHGIGRRRRARRGNLPSWSQQN